MISHFFIDRPIFASVLSIVLVIVGVVALSQLPIAQYPEVAPPTVQVSAIYPGANAQVVADTVASPIEQEVNGVENMLYMSSKCTNDGQMYLDVTFALGTDLNMAQVLVQNRVAVAEAKLPEEVKRQGVTTKKKSPSILLCVNLISPGGRYNQLYLSNFATIQVKDALARLKGVGDVTFLGPRDYSMRIWLDPEKLARLNMTPADVIAAVKEQNVQVAAGQLGQAPAPPGQSFQLTVKTLGRLTEAEDFKKIVVKVGQDGEVVYLKDVVSTDPEDKSGRDTTRVELGAKNYDVGSYLDNDESVTLAVFQLPGSNAIETAGLIRKTMEGLRASNVWSEGIEYRIVYDTTVFVEESIHSVFHTLLEAFVLVFLVVLIFLQNWRATLIPMIAVPVSLIGTFAFMAMLGFSLNNLSLFGMVLAIGIVVDDAIVVVENVETHLSRGLSPRDAARKAMEEVTGPVIAIALVLCAVFVPTAFMAGISGQFYKQFALTIAVSTVISAFNSLTLSPALCTLLLKPHGHGHAKEDALPRLGIVLIGGLLAVIFLTPRVGPLVGLPSGGHGAEHGSAAASPALVWGLRGALFLAGAAAGWFAAWAVNRGLAWFFGGFNRGFDATSNGYARGVGLLVRVAPLVLLAYAGLMALTFQGFRTVPVGFIPEQDKGYLVVNAQLPDGASLERTEAVVAHLRDIALKTPGVDHTISVPGYSIVLGTNLTNVGGLFVILKPFEERKGDRSVSAPAVMAQLRKSYQEIREARVGVFGAPPVDGLGSTGGFKLQVQDRGGSGPAALEGAVQELAAQGNAQRGRLTGLFSSFTANQPQIFLEVDRVKVKSMQVDLEEVFATLQAYLGSSYVNDFTRFNRNWQVNVQADARYRLQPEDIGRLEVRNARGERVPLSTLLTVRDVTGPAIVNHYNMYPSAEITGNTAPGTSSGQAISIMNALSKKELTGGMESEWTELTLQQILAEQDLLTKLVFPLAVVFVFLTLAAQYESWTLPLAIILIVPMCLLAAITGVWLTGLDNNIFTQIGLVVLIGLAAKNAILIVEFAREREDSGLSRSEAAVQAARMRLRPILMTSFAFILGVVPLVLASGAGAEMRYALGVAVFSGMIGVTLFGIFFTPVFYVVIRWLTARGESAPPSAIQQLPEA
ncbi:MAG: efflux RND transporter permease subunit [Gemmataceae bacterium]|nr:efflux RND transporter permease subunit [Gemmataceae bacterium]